VEGLSGSSGSSKGVGARGSFVTDRVVGVIVVKSSGLWFRRRVRVGNTVINVLLGELQSAKFVRGEDQVRRLQVGSGGLGFNVYVAPSSNEPSCP
jgi:hypothetical protein